MAHRLQCISLVVCLLAGHYVAAQDILGKIFPTDALWSCTKKDFIHSHLQRILQVEAESEEPESLESCSPAALTQLNKCMAKPAIGLRSANVSPVKSAPGNGTNVTKCVGSDCPTSPTSSSKAPTGGQSSSSEHQVPAQRAATYGPMSQGAFARMVQRKRASLRAELQKAGLLTAELDAFLRGAKGGEAKDSFGIPLPVGSKAPRPSADFEMRFAPQAPPAAPATAADTASSSAATTTAAAATRTEETSAAPEDFDMRFEPQTPALDPNVLKSELEAFIAASPAPQDAVGESDSITGPAQQERLAVTEEEPTSALTTQSGAIGPTRPPMTEQEAARLAAQLAANAAAREAALARKRQMAREELTASSSSGGKKAMRALGLNSSTTGAPAASAAATASGGSPEAHRVHASSQSQRPQQADQRLRSGSSFSTSASAAVKGAKRTAAAAGAAASWGKLAYVLVALLVVASAVGMFVGAAVMEDALFERHSSRKAGGGDWLVLTRGLWRRCRRAFSAARKQLTGHGSDLPLSANEGTGPLARAVAAASAFVHVFWSHLADHRGQHIGGAVAAALDASRRASAGGFAPVVPDRTSTGGACAYSTSTSCYTSDATPFAAPHYQRRRV